MHWKYYLRNRETPGHTDNTEDESIDMQEEEVI